MIYLIFIVYYNLNIILILFDEKLSKNLKLLHQTNEIFKILKNIIQNNL